ncbi:MFS transporter, DHA1 family, bicyclomycin/chloramphenicol resistance protein [Duganella sp. CF458]|uniref:MFS transporter n=1 Tax=Duganella sp. CF458 TaxID=1884368 RepID=UPI0008EB3E53|nr:MFS transporter [Duganella sp. CF458]SFF54622.1 MFS transporter, DHA1 family, bicyclomycin/chloramphenicol resistance protein [Duganella sp. CF458]
MRARLHLTLSLASLAALGPLAFDAVLPALPALGKEFGLSLPAAQSLLSVYMAALASAHLLFAWTSNALGKRAVLIGGTLLLTAGSALCALAQVPWELQAGRVLQGLGAGAAAALLPLLMRPHASRRLRLLTDGAIPILAPAIGALLVLGAGWRYTFWMAVAACLLLLVLLASAPAAANKAGDEFQFGELMGNFTYLRYAACHALCFGAMMAGAATLPVMISLDLGLGAAHIALLQAAGASVMLVQSFGNPGGPTRQRVTGGIAVMIMAAAFIVAWNQLEQGVDPFYYLFGCWAALCAGFSACAMPLTAGALKAAGRHARAGLSLLQFASHAVAAAAIRLTAKGNVEDAALITFGSAAVMVIAGAALLPGFIWRSADIKH